MTRQGLRRSFKSKILTGGGDSIPQITSIDCDECFQLRTYFCQYDLKCPKHSRSTESDDENTEASSFCSVSVSGASGLSQGEDALWIENRQLKTQLANVMAKVEKSRSNDNNSTQASHIELKRLQAKNIRLSDENLILKMKLDAKVINDKMAEIDLLETREPSNFRLNGISAAVSSSASALSSNMIDAELDAKTEEISLKVIKKGDIKLTLDVMRTHLRFSRVQEEACRALQTLSLQEKGFFSMSVNNQNELQRAGAIRVILDAMKNHPGVAEVQVEAFVALACLSCGNEHNKNEISEIGGIDAIVHGMSRHLDSACVQEKGSFALYALSTKKDHNLGAMRDFKIRDAGGIQAICNGMARHPTVESVHYCAIAALSRIR